MNKENLIRVSYLLKRAGLIQEFPLTPQMRHILMRGSAVHRYSIGLDTAFDNGGESEAKKYIETFPLNLQVYGQSILDFRKKFDVNYVRVEQRIDDPALRLTGCPDRVGTWLHPSEGVGHNAVFDYKTGNEYNWHRLQLALYSILIERDPNYPFFITKRISVYLGKDGTSRTVVHDNKKDIAEAWSLIQRYLINENEVTINANK
jgi:hypothetical protein|tara:strand:- start:3773 stop:4384 length:612 start_codon:yes stop_codon:yes gene_type:complete